MPTLSNTRIFHCERQLMAQRVINEGLLCGRNITGLTVRCVSVVTIGERLLLSNENLRVRKKLNCPTADTGEFTLLTHCSQWGILKADLQRKGKGRRAFASLLNEV